MDSPVNAYTALKPAPSIVELDTNSMSIGPGELISGGVEEPQYLVFNRSSASYT